MLKKRSSAWYCLLLTLLCSVAPCHALDTSVLALGDELEKLTLAFREREQKFENVIKEHARKAASETGATHVVIPFHKFQLEGITPQLVDTWGKKAKVTAEVLLDRREVVVCWANDFACVSALLNSAVRFNNEDSLKSNKIEC